MVWGLAGGGALCLDFSENLLENDPKYFSSLWHCFIVLQNKLRLNAEQTAVQYQIWQFCKPSNFNWLVHHNFKLNGVLMVAVKDKRH